MHTGDIANTCADIAHLKIATGELPEAGKYAGQSIAAAKESGQKATMANSLITMAELKLSFTADDPRGKCDSAFNRSKGAKLTCPSTRNMSS